MLEYDPFYVPAAAPCSCLGKVPILKSALLHIAVVDVRFAFVDLPHSVSLVGP